MCFTNTPLSFFENVDRITTPGYMATVEDILFTRLETTKIVEAVFAHKDLKFKLVHALLDMLLLDF